MVAKAGVYYGLASQVFKGVTQGGALSPTIFNVVVDAVVRHWVEVMVEGADNQGGSGQEGRHQNSLFYADEGMVASSDTSWIQGVFITLVGLFDRVGLNTNIRKTFLLVCHPCQVAGTQSEALYGQRITGVGNSYWERQRVRVQCTYCGEETTLGSLEFHL